MKKMLIDTNVYTHFKKNTKDVIHALQTVEHIVINNIVLGELFSGFKLGNREKQNKYELDEFLSSSRVDIVSSDEETAEFYAIIFAQLKRKGCPIPTNDIWIAASAMQHGLPIYTLDSHFSNIDGLRIV